MEHHKELTVLDLGHTAVSDAGLVRLKHLTELSVLCIGGTQVTCAGSNRLKESLPRMSVYP
jgi:hypothetical protein